MNQFGGMSILSLRNGREIGRIGLPIIDPNNLKVVAFYVDSRRVNQELVVFSEDIREVSPRGVIVDSEDNLMELEGLVRLEELLSINFQLDNKKVVTDKGRVLGKVSESTIDDISFLTKKLYVRPTALKSLTNSDLIIDRKQIVEVTDKQIVVRDSVVKAENRKPAFSPLTQ